MAPLRSNKRFQRALGANAMLVLPFNVGSGAGPVRRGMEKAAARRLLEDLGYPLSAKHGELDYFCENSLPLEYDRGRVRFIGISKPSGD